SQRAHVPAPRKSATRRTASSPRRPSTPRSPSAFQPPRGARASARVQNLQPAYFRRAFDNVGVSGGRRHAPPTAPPRQETQPLNIAFSARTPSRVTSARQTSPGEARGYEGIPVHVTSSPFFV